jgi:uncharacterized RDD family membrane protein YckC
VSLIDPRYSPDGLWWWDGSRWLPTAGSPVALGPATVQYAGFWLRFVAWLIDAIGLWFVGAVLGLVFGFVGGILDSTTGANGTIQSIASVLAYAIGLAGQWLYFSLMESSAHQATLGKLALGIRVIDYEGGRISFGRATGRYFGKLISGLLCYVGFAMAGFTDRKQALHDIMASTLVVRRHPVHGQLLSAPAAGQNAGMILGGIAAAVGILVLTSILVIVILLTMGGQIKNVLSNVVVALNT